MFYSRFLSPQTVPGTGFMSILSPPIVCIFIPNRIDKLVDSLQLLCIRRGRRKLSILEGYIRGGRRKLSILKGIILEEEGGS